MQLWDQEMHWDLPLVIEVVNEKMNMLLQDRLSFVLLVGYPGEEFINWLQDLFGLQRHLYIPVFAFLDVVF